MFTYDLQQQRRQFRPIVGVCYVQPPYRSNTPSLLVSLLLLPDLAALDARIMREFLVAAETWNPFEATPSQLDGLASFSRRTKDTGGPKARRGEANAPCSLDMRLSG